MDEKETLKRTRYMFKELLPHWLHTVNLNNADLFHEIPPLPYKSDELELINQCLRDVKSCLDNLTNTPEKPLKDVIMLVYASELPTYEVAKKVGFSISWVDKAKREGLLEFAKLFDKCLLNANYHI